jgi:hypothetical protein
MGILFKDLEEKLPEGSDNFILIPINISNPPMVWNCSRERFFEKLQDTNKKLSINRSTLHHPLF